MAAPALGVMYPGCNKLINQSNYSDELNLTNLELRMEYADRTWEFEFPYDVENALEDDYVKNRAIYTDEILKEIKGLYLLRTDITPQEILNYVHNSNNN